MKRQNNIASQRQGIGSSHSLFQSRYKENDIFLMKCSISQGQTAMDGGLRFPAAGRRMETDPHPANTFSAFH